MSIPLHLVTGFLGSGKTSFLNHYLQNFKGEGRIAIIQNEFSPVNVDGRKLQQTTDYEVLEINNGSVFCVCLLGSFIDSLSAFVEKNRPDALIMEASGLSDPIGVGQIFQSEKLKGKVYLEHVWCLIDAQNFDRIPALKLRFDHQIRSADTVIVNKIDLAGDKTEMVVSQVKKTNPFARVLVGKYGEVDLGNFKKALNLFPVSHEESLGRPDIESVVIRSSREIKREMLQQFLKNIQKECIRCKGFVKLSDGKPVFLQGVFSEIKLEEVSAFSGPTEFVLIGNFEPQRNLQVIFDEYARK